MHDEDWAPWIDVARALGEPQSYLTYAMHSGKIPIRSGGPGSTAYVRAADVRALRAANRRAKRRQTPLAETVLRPATSGPLAESA